jgi:hypothetical protein
MGYDKNGLYNRILNSGEVYQKRPDLPITNSLGTIFLHNINYINMDKNGIYTWILKIIDTCSNDFHFEAVDKLIELFKEKEKDESLTDDLKLARIQKWNEIHTIL